MSDWAQKYRQALLKLSEAGVGDDIAFARWRLGFDHYREVLAHADKDCVRVTTVDLNSFDVTLYGLRVIPVIDPKMAVLEHPYGKTVAV
jgi:hypothetical protein